MPPLSARFIRYSLIYLAIGMTFGALMQTNAALVYYPRLWKLLPIHIEMMMMGWFIQLAMGVAFWILPRWSSSPTPRGNERLVLLAFWLINLGIWLTVLEVLIPFSWLILAGRLLEVAGVTAFVAATWKRVKPFGKQ